MQDTGLAESVDHRLKIRKDVKKYIKPLGQERSPHMEEKVKDILEKIRRTAEIILEHQTTRAFKNKIITLGAESIVTISKEALDEIEKEKKQE